MNRRRHLARRLERLERLRAAQAQAATDGVRDAVFRVARRPSPQEWNLHAAIAYLRKRQWQQEHPGEATPADVEGMPWFAADLEQCACRSWELTPAQRQELSQAGFPPIG